MGLFETQEVTKRIAREKIRVIREQITADETDITQLEEKKHKMWMEIKDFGSADAVHADKGYAYMSKLHGQITKLKKAITAAKKKIKLLEEAE